MRNFIIRWTLLTVAALVGCTDAQAAIDLQKGNGLLPLCQANFVVNPSETQRQEGNYCAAFVSGFWEGAYAAYSLAEVDAERAKRKPYKRSWCMPRPPITYEQIVRVFVKYLEDHPERLHMYAAVLLSEALTQAFPCK